MRLDRRAHLVTREVHEPNAPAPGEERLVAIGQRLIAGAVRHDEDFEEGHGGGDELARPLVGFTKQGIDQR